MVYGDLTCPFTLPRPRSKTTLDLNFREVYKQAHLDATIRPERQIRVEQVSEAWYVNVGYWNGTRFLAYRTLGPFTVWEHVIKIVDNHTKNYRGKIKVLGFDAGERIEDGPERTNADQG